MTVALPVVSGLNTPAGIGSPEIGISHSSYAFPGGESRQVSHQED